MSWIPFGQKGDESKETNLRVRVLRTTELRPSLSFCLNFFLKSLNLSLSLDVENLSGEGEFEFYEDDVLQAFKIRSKQVRWGPKDIERGVLGIGL